MCVAKQLKNMWRIKRNDIRKENILLESEVNIMANFIVQFPLKTEMYQEDMLNKRFEIGRRIYWLDKNTPSIISDLGGDELSFSLSKKSQETA